MTIDSHLWHRPSVPVCFYASRHSRSVATLSSIPRWIRTYKVPQLGSFEPVAYLSRRTCTMEPSQSTQKFGLNVSDISCKGLPRVGSLKFIKRRLGSFYVEVGIAGAVRRTLVSKPSEDPLWKDILKFHLEGDNELTIQVVEQRRPGKTNLVGELKSPIAITQDFPDTKKFSEQPLVLRGKKNLQTGIISFTLTRLNDLDTSESNSARVQIELVNKALSESNIEGETKLETLSDYMSKAEDVTIVFTKILKPLLDKVDVIVKIGNLIAEIHPYAQMVWLILSPALKAIDEQRKRDEKIMILVVAMNDAYDFVDLTKPLQIEDLAHDDTRKQIIKQLLQQTYNCAWFIRDYTASGGFFARALSGVASGSSHDSIVQQYIDNFGKLKECFKTETLVRIEITVHQAQAMMQKTYDSSVLNSMVVAQSRDLPEECLPGTREDILRDIIDWIHRPFTSPEDPGPCVYWLHGVAGCGKSAIAATIAEKFNGPGVKRCARYFFDASRQIEAGPQKLFSTLSRTFADLDGRWRELLVKTIESSQDVRTTLSIKEQFENFILKPAEDFKPVGPILAVIDALDESGSKHNRAMLLRMLARLGELNDHGRFRFLITSRPEEDIFPVFTNKPWVLSRDLTNINETSTDNDIRQYVDEELSQVHSLIRKWPEKPWVELIATRSEHLFQWAFVACNFIKGVGESGVYPPERYIHLRDHQEDTLVGNLDELYITVLRELYGPEEDNDKILRFRKVLGRVLSAREPLSLQSLTELRQEEEDEEETELIVCSLGSLLKGVNREDRHEPIQPLHVSFVDFLFDPKRSSGFYVRARSEDASLAQACLRAMNKYLRFNICDLETSYLRNRDIGDLSNRVRQNIPEHLLYACRYFAEHLSHCESNGNLLGLIDAFLREKLLFWLEVLSLLKNISQAVNALSTLQVWVKENKTDKETELIIEDAIRFVQAYGGAMETSTPHIYLSLLAFIPLDSPLHTSYVDSYPLGLKAASDSGQLVKWTSMLLKIQASDDVLAVGFSPNGKLIVSGSSDSTIRVWDAHTGQPVGDPFQGHAKSVTSVGFSPDAKVSVSASYDRTIRLWDMLTGQPIGDSFQGHTDAVRSVRFSPNGKLIVSGSSDSTVRVWDVRTGLTVGDPFRGHTLGVASVCFSPDSKLIASGSDDSSIQLWHVHTGRPVGNPLQGHSEEVRSVRFSPDGVLIVSGSDDCTVCVWDIHTREIVARLFHGNFQSVTSVGFSPDCKFVVSGCSDSIIRVWDAHTGQLVGNSFYGHTDSVTSVEFSPDGKLVVSGSFDGTIRAWEIYAGQPARDFPRLRGLVEGISSVAVSHNGNLVVSGSYDNIIRVWDLQTRQLVCDSFQGHNWWATSVGFSPNGKFIVSGSIDRTVRLWDVYTGQAVGGPFQGHDSSVTSVTFSPDAKFVASGSVDTTIRVWDVSSGSPAGDPFRGHTDIITSVCFSPDGGFIVSGSRDRTVRVWNIHTSQPIGDPLQGHTDEITSVIFSPNGNIVISASNDRSIRVWDFYAGQSIGNPIRGHTDSVTSIGISYDSNFIVSGSSDKTIRVWNVHTGQAACDPILGHSLSITGISVVSPPDCEFLQFVSGSDDGTIRIWKIQTPADFLSRSSILPTFSPSISEPSNHQDYERFNNTVCFTDSSTMDDDGWMLGSCNELLFWIPPTYRPNLWRPSNTGVIGRDSLKLELTRCVHGPDWHKCRKL